MVSFRAGKFLYVRDIGLGISFFLFFHCTHNITRMQFFASLYATEQLWMDFCYVASTNTMHKEATPFGNRTSVIGSKSITSK
jgi:hypothetical protein